MVQECPHCHTRVLPKEDNLCPACGKNVLDTIQADLSVRSLTVKGAVTLPYCCTCCTPTDRIVTVREKFPENELAKFIEALIDYRSPHFSPTERRRTVIVKLPQCKECGKKGKPKPTHVDFEHDEMTFLVHYKFYEYYWAVQNRYNARRAAGG